MAAAFLRNLYTGLTCVDAYLMRADLQFIQAFCLDMWEANMNNRIVVFVCGLAAGWLLDAALPPQAHVAPASVVAAGAASADARCVAHPVKMPCLFDAGH